MTSIAILFPLLLPILCLPAQDRPPLRPQNRAQAPTFNRDIAPIVFEHCSTCHRKGESAPFELLTYKDVRKRARQIVKVTQSRFMPPWLPEEGHGEFEGTRRLRASERKLLQRWEAEGRLEGEAKDLPKAPEFTKGWSLGEPDLVVTLVEPYKLAAGGPDQFRNFVVPIPVEQSRFVRAVEFRTGGSRAVHHAIVQVDRSGSCQALDREAPGLGFPGMAMGQSEPPDGHFIGWTPGKQPHASPPGLAWRLIRGSQFVVQLHLTPTGKPESVQPRIGLYFTDVPPTRYPYSITLYREDIDIPAGAAEHVITDSYTLPADVELIGIYPHAHFLGKRISGEAELPNGKKLSLLRIDNWDFNWQDDYRYKQPIDLPKGTKVTMKIVYDNSSDNPSNPFDPPKSVTFGESSEDEMGTLTLEVVPKDPRDHRALNFARWQHALKKKPYDWDAYNRLAILHCEAGEYKAALGPLQKALKLRPEYPDALANLGLALEGLRRFEEAERCFREAIRIDDRHANAHNHLGRILMMQRKPKDAAREFERSLSLRPDFADAHSNLGNLLAMSSRYDEAIEHYKAALRIAPDAAKTHNNLANTYFAKDDLKAAAHEYQLALRYSPQYYFAQLNLARVRILQQQWPAAELALKRARKLRPDDPELDRLASELKRRRSP